MRAYLFPGQGSQYIGMGRDLLQSDFYPLSLERQVDQILGYSLKDICLNGTQEQLRQTQYTQPCLFIVNALHYQKHCVDTCNAAYFAGHSLGEYNALHAAGAFDILTGLRLVQRRGELMAEAPKGAMAAVLGIDADAVERALKHHQLTKLDIANFNTPEQVVISGLEEEIPRAESAMMSAGATGCILLQVSAAFHSRYMENVALEFSHFLQDIAFKPLNVAVISNVTARPYPMQGGRRTHELLVQQIKSQVRWSPSIGYLKAKGIETFIEAGPGMTLTNMLRKIPALSVLEEQDKHAESEQNSYPDDNAQPVVLTEEIKEEGRLGAEDRISPEALGSKSFMSDYGVKYAYVAGAMFKGIASKEMVSAMGKQKLLSYLGTGGMRLDEIEKAIRYIKDAVADGPYGMNLLHHPDDPELEESTVDCYLKHGVENIEAAAYTTLSPALIRFRLTGFAEEVDSNSHRRHRIMAKVSRPEVAAMFMRPAPEAMVKRLLEAGKITQQQAELARRIPMADDICVEADSGGHTDGGAAIALFPAIVLLRDEIAQEYPTAPSIRVGAAGGIGTPQSAAAAFIMGADFILTGSVNQCTVEAGTSDSVKDLLETIGAQDTAYAPAGDMFEYGAKIQVVRKGLFFHTRANMLYELYSRYDSLDDIPASMRRKIEDKFFKRTFEHVWSEIRAYHEQKGNSALSEIENNPKKKMAHIFKWYFVHSNRLALEGSQEQKVDYQIQCGPALGAFNQWVKGTPYEPWRSRSVSKIADLLMKGTSDYLTKRINMYH
jgi:trans-AT polyketide synthase/acyltransferase/oxidoreductase domain-containing protein